MFEVNDSDDQRWARKAIDGTKASRNKLKRFQNEIQFCYRSSSKCIVQGLDFGKTDDGSLFYIMSLYPDTLRGLMNVGIGKSEVLPLYSQILDGVPRSPCSVPCSIEMYGKRFPVCASMPELTEFRSAHGYSRNSKARQGFYRDGFAHDKPGAKC